MHSSTCQTPLPRPSSPGIFTPLKVHQPYSFHTSQVSKAMADRSPSPPQVQCTCRCRDEKPAFCPQAESWDKALEQHKGKFVSLVADRSPLIAFIYQLLGVAPPKFDQMGYRISIAEMHRMHMRALQIELVQMAVALQFDINAEESSEARRAKLKAARQDALRKLEPAIEKYSTV